MSPASRRKTGPSANRSRLARKLVRDRKIYRILRSAVGHSKNRHRLLLEPIEPLSVYGGKQDHPRGDKLTVFPITHQANGAKMPSWNDLTPWLKAQVLVMSFNEWHLQTFSVHLHRDLEDDCLKRGLDSRIVIRDRLRKRLRKLLPRRPEYFFVIEGWSKKSKAKVPLHIHGGIFLEDPSEGPAVMEAVAKACGQGLRGAKPEPRAVHGRLFWREGPRYVDYLFKSVRKPDDRLNRRRLHLSQEAVGAGREMWGLMTEPWP